MDVGKRKRYNKASGIGYRGDVDSGRGRHVYLRASDMYIYRQKKEDY